LAIFFLLFVFVSAFALSLAFTPWVARLACRVGALDHPDSVRKNHVESVALGGGLLVAATTAVVLGMSQLVGPLQQSGLWAALPGYDLAFLDLAFLDLGFLPSMIPGVIALLLLGIVDDTAGPQGISGKYKLFGQFVAVSLLMAQGIHFDVFSLFGWEWALGSWSLPITMFFFLGAINAFNLLDGADGLAASIGVLVCLTLGIASFAQGSMESALLCIAFAGALAGFLKYNAPPASIYLGDTGSMLIGLVVATVSIQCSIKQHATMALVVPAAICAIPILDAAAAFVRRTMTGQSVFAGDRGHLHHALLQRGWSVGKTVAFIASLTALTCAGALASFFTGYDMIAVGTTLLVIAALGGARVFGHGELALIRSHSRSLARTIIMGRLPVGEQSASQEVVHLQGHRSWEKLWSALLESAADYQLSGIRLTINIPRLHESYYGNWKQAGGTVRGNVWQMVLPLHLKGESIGRISLLGDMSKADGVKNLQQVLDFLEPLEENIAYVLEEQQLDVPQMLPSSTSIDPVKQTAELEFDLMGVQEAPSL